MKALSLPASQFVSASAALLRTQFVDGGTLLEAIQGGRFRLADGSPALVRPGSCLHAALMRPLGKREPVCS